MDQQTLIEKYHRQLETLLRNNDPKTDKYTHTMVEIIETSLRYLKKGCDSSA